MPKAIILDGISGRGAEGDELEWDLRTRSRRRQVGTASLDEELKATSWEGISGRGSNLTTFMIFKFFELNLLENAHLFVYLFFFLVI